MWENFKKQNGQCAQYSAELEDLPMGAGAAEASAELTRNVAPELLAHAEQCDSCREATETFWASRALLAGPLLEQRAELEAALGEKSPWFATRIMANIGERETEVRAAKTEWSGAVTKLASRLAGVSAVILLLTSTWLYSPPNGGPQKSGAQNTGAQQQANGSQAGASAEAPQYLFDSTTAPSNVDDALASPAER
jgi:hypothetical protein